MKQPKDNLEDFIRSNKDQLDIYEPSDKVWEHIAKANSSKKVVSLYRVRYAVGIAASVAFLIGIFFFINQSDSLDRKNTTVATNQEIIIPELQEVEDYYNLQMNKKLVVLEKYSDQFPEIEQEVRYDLAELDSVCAELKRDLKDDIANEEVIEAMIQSHRLKLKILEDILTRLEKTEKQDKDEEEYII